MSETNAVLERTLTLNGIELHVTIAGAGAPVLVLHGVTMNSTFHDRDILALSRSFLVIAPDLRGHGRSSRPAEYTMRDHVQDMVALLNALSIDTVYVVGASMGSYIAQALAIAAPDRVKKLVLVVAKASGITSSSARYLAEHADQLVDLSPEQQQEWLSDRMFAPNASSAVRTAMKRWVGAQQKAGLALTTPQVQAANDALAGFDFRNDLRQLHIPSLVISGRYDILNPRDDGEEIVRLLPDARLEVFEHSGHLLTREEPEHFSEVLGAFLCQ
jgi:3-oxoadipate enol-lactonase